LPKTCVGDRFLAEALIEIPLLKARFDKRANKLSTVQLDLVLKLCP